MKQALLFSIPKPFIGNIATIQHNAFASWSLLENTRVVILGDEAGITDAAARYGFDSIPDIPRNEHGTPFLDSAFKAVAQLASNDAVLVFSNADIILLPTLSRVIQDIPYVDYLVAARRYNLNLEHQCVASADAFALLELNARLLSDIVPPFSSDIFVLPSRSSIINLMPQMLIGRKGWDNWMMWAARNLSLPLIDATDYIVTVHQNHGYEHIRRDKDFDISKSPWEGPESEYQEKLIGNHAIDLNFATERVHSNGALVSKYVGIEKLYWHCYWKSRSGSSFYIRHGYRLMKKLLSFGLT